MHVFFINKYQTEFTESIDKTYMDIFLKHELLNFHGTFPYLDPAAAQQSQSLQWSSLLSLFSP
jgi:hypothetical protein